MWKSEPECLARKRYHKAPESAFETVAFQRTMVPSGAGEGMEENKATDMAACNWAAPNRAESANPTTSRLVLTGCFNRTYLQSEMLKVVVPYRPGAKRWHRPSACASHSKV